MASSSGVSFFPYLDDNYRLDNLSLTNVRTFEDITVPTVHSVLPTGIQSGASGRFETTFQKVGEQCFRKDIISSGSVSGYVNLDFSWEAFNSNNEIVDFEKEQVERNIVNGYKISIYDKTNRNLLRNYNLSTFITGFSSTGLSGFAGNEASTGYFFTGASGFAGASGVTGNGLTGAFNYVLTDTGLNAYGLVESGFLVSQNTYIPINGTGASTIFGLRESGFNVVESGFNGNQFTFPAKDQYEIFTGENADFNLKIQNSTIESVSFESTKRFRAVQPEIDKARAEISSDVVSFFAISNSSSQLKVTGLAGDLNIYNEAVEEGGFFELSISQIPNRFINYSIIPSDRYSDGTATETGFINNVFFSGLSISETNVGTDPGIRLNWNIYDDITSGANNLYYHQYIQIFDPNRDGNNTKFDLNQEPHVEYSPDFGILISGSTGFGHGLIDYDATGATSGFAGISGVTGNGLSGLLTYEPVSEPLLPSGVTGAFGIAESGFTLIQGLITKQLSEAVFNFNDLSGNSISALSGNIADFSFKDCNIDSNEVGVFVWANTYDGSFITGELITGSALKTYFINQSGFGLSTSGPYDINLSLGSGNSIQSKKSSPGSMKFISTDEQNKSLDIMFANTSGFGSALTGDVEISLGSSNKISSDGGGNIDFKSVPTGDAEETSLFNITSDPDIPSVFRSDLEIHMPETGYGITGYKLYFGTSSQNTDPIYLTRFDTESDDSELRLYLGDNHGDSSNYDKFLVGGVAYPSENLSTVFSVTTQNDTGAVGILTDSPIFPFHIKASVPGTEHTYIASIDNESNDGGGLWLEVGDNDNSEDALRISNPNITEHLLRIKSQSGIFIAYDQLPSIDPEVKGQVYRDASNFLKISAG